MSLVLVGLWLAAVGLGDLGRASQDSMSGRRLAGCLGLGLLMLMAGLAVLPVAAGWAVLMLLVFAGLLVGWLVASTTALAPTGPARRRGAARGVALAALCTGVAIGAAGAQVIDAPLQWADWLSQTLLTRWPASDVVVAVGVVLVQLATANTIVRLVLEAVGVPATTNEKQLKGGRVLGPMERIFIVGLGALGELTAAAIVVAAKGLLRFPELHHAQRRAGHEPDGPSDVSEYFLIGSFASWLFALGGAALIYLA
jgi:MFS family permease